MDSDATPEQPLTLDMLYVDLEHFIATTETRPLPNSGKRVVSVGGPFIGFPLEGQSAGEPI